MANVNASFFTMLFNGTPINMCNGPGECDMCVLPVTTARINEPSALCVRERVQAEQSQLRGKVLNRRSIC